MFFNTSTPKIINFPFGTNGKLLVLGVPKFKHIRVLLQTLHSLIRLKVYTIYTISSGILHLNVLILWFMINPIALRKDKIAYNFGLSECNRVKGIHRLVLVISCENVQAPFCQPSAHL